MSFHGGNVAHGVRDDLAVLDVEAANLRELAVSGTRGCQELGDDGELALCVDSQAGAVKIVITHAVGVEVASVRVAFRGIARVW